jgi:type IV secretory pathway protease TraF
MKKVVALISVVLLTLSAQPAQAAPKVTVLNPSKVSTKTGLVTITVSGLPTTNGIYISQCMGIDKGKTEPAA